MTKGHWLRCLQVSKARLRKKGYLKGVIVDIAYDHLLLKNWHKYASIDKPNFIQEFYACAQVEVVNYPQNAQEFVHRLISSKLLTSYTTLSGLHAALIRIDRRLSNRILAKETASSYFADLEREIDAMEEDFLQFFPQLIEHFKCNSGLEERDHWLL